MNRIGYVCGLAVLLGSLAPALAVTCSVAGSKDYTLASCRIDAQTVCFTEDKKLIAALQTRTAKSKLTVSRNGSTCRYISVSN